jgi:MFS family permease
VSSNQQRDGLQRAQASGERGLLALGVTMGIQSFTALSATATSVLAPEIAPALGISAKLIGVFVGLIYLAAMAASLVSGFFISRFGSIRVSQYCVVACACGLLLVCGPWWSFLLAPLLIGLGYGPITPASSELLARTAPRRRLALTFSIKQTGVPIGAALAGALMPMLALSVGWRLALGVSAVSGLAIVLAAQSTRNALDAPSGEGTDFSLRALIAPLKLVMADRRLIELAFTGFFYAATQVCLVSFLVIYLTESLGRALVAAGLALTVANVGGIVGRIMWGAVADRWIAPRTMLAVLGFIAGGCSLATAAFSSESPSWLVLSVCALFGGSAIGWNGVQLAEVARNAPEGQVGAMTGGCGFVTFAGVVIGPPVFAALVALTGNYRVGFMVFAATPIACGFWLLSRKK